MNIILAVIASFCFSLAVGQIAASPTLGFLTFLICWAMFAMGTVE